KKSAKTAGDDWDMARGANALAGDGLDRLVIDVVQDYVMVHQATLEDLKANPDIAAADKAKILASLADAFNKTVNAAGRLSPKISELGVAQDVLHRLVHYVRSDFPQHAAAMLEVLEPFGETLAEAYGK